MNKSLHEIGIVGLGVMGLNLARNVASNDYAVLGWDPQEEQRRLAEDHHIPCSSSLKNMVDLLESPRKILLMVPAGDVVDHVIQSIQPSLVAGDIIMDGGNSFFKDTDRRSQQLAAKGIHYLGLGISGGHKGALEGPAIMAGGDKEAYAKIQPMLEALAASYEGTPCVDHMGKGSAGHYVKMIHNGIEYGLMQILAEAFDLLVQLEGYSYRQCADIFQLWNKGRLQGYLLGITADILAKSSGKNPILDQIFDAAGQKGTGSWTAQNALELGVPVPGIDAAIRMRQISGYWKERQALNSTLNTNLQVQQGSITSAELVEKAVYAAMLLVFIQGCHQLQVASREYGYSYTLSQVAKTWRNGCIINTQMVRFLAEALESTTVHPLLVPTISNELKDATAGLRFVVSHSALGGLSLPGMSANLGYWDAFSRAKLPTNLVQAQRDYFGGHGYQTSADSTLTSYPWEDIEPTN